MTKYPRFMSAAGRRFCTESSRRRRSDRSDAPAARLSEQSVRANPKGSSFTAANHFFSAGTGNVTVSGTGSTISVVAGNLAVGDAGTGSLTVDGGATVTIDSGNQDPNIEGDFSDLVVGAQAGGVGTLTISGVGSSVTTIGTDNVTRIGFNGGDGTLLVENGGTLDTYFFEVARNPGSVGVATEPHSPPSSRSRTAAR